MCPTILRCAKHKDHSKSLRGISFSTAHQNAFLGKGRHFPCGFTPGPWQSWKVSNAHMTIKLKKHIPMNYLSPLETPNTKPKHLAARPPCLPHVGAIALFREVSPELMTCNTGCLVIKKGVPWIKWLVVLTIKKVVDDANHQKCRTSCKWMYMIIKRRDSSYHPINCLHCTNLYCIYMSSPITCIYHIYYIIYIYTVCVIFESSDNDM